MSINQNFEVRLFYSPITTDIYLPSEPEKFDSYSGTEWEWASVPTNFSSKNVYLLIFPQEIISPGDEDSSIESWEHWRKENLASFKVKLFRRKGLEKTFDEKWVPSVSMGHFIEK